jgi:hypothetical protein
MIVTPLLAALAALPPSATPASRQSIVFDGTDKHIRYIGRFDTRDSNGPRCAWTASAVEIHYRGKDLDAQIVDAGKDFIQVEVDGVPTQVLELANTSTDYTVNVPAEGEHTVRLVKRTEAGIGTVQFRWFKVGGKLLPTKGPKRRIEIIGDSISCGYGDEGKVQTEHFTPATENGYLAYGPVAARAVGADCDVIAWSGRKMWPDNTVPSIYDLTLPTDPASKWDFHGPEPEAVLINLATNDFGPGNPDETKWTGAYADFIAHLRTHYPKAMVYCAIGSMMSDEWPPNNHALTTLRGYLARMVSRINAAGDNRVKVLEFAQQRQEDGIGADWHPNLKTHQKMADVFVAALHRDLGW